MASDVRRRALRFLECLGRVRSEKFTAHIEGHWDAEKFDYVCPKRCPVAALAREGKALMVALSDSLRPRIRVAERPERSKP